MYYSKVCTYLHVKHIKNPKTFNNTKEISYQLIQSTSRMKAERKNINELKIMKSK